MFKIQVLSIFSLNDRQMIEFLLKDRDLLAFAQINYRSL